jgi:hypothetical protein
MQLGRLREAIDVMAPAFGDQRASNSGDAIVRVMVRYVEIAQQIPIEAMKIERAYSEIDDALASYDLRSYRHEVLVMKARWLRFQGRMQDSLSLAREALAGRRLNPNTSGQVLDYHYDGIVTLCLDLGMIDDAKVYLASWLSEPDTMPENRRLRYAKCAAEVATWLGDLRKAAEYAEHAIYYARRADYEEAQAAALFAYCRALTEDRKLAAVRRVLCEFARLRHSERTYVRRELWLWWVRCFSGRFSRDVGGGQADDGSQLATKMALRYSAVLDKLLNSDFWVRQAKHQIAGQQGWYR